MSQFEFIAVFVSIIFGLSLTQILSGTVQQAQQRKLERSHLGWTLFVLYMVVINWWTFFPWAQNEIWEFEEFLVILVWSLSHYVMAAALYPRDMDGYSFREKSRGVMLAFLAAGALDMAQTATRGDFFQPWYYSLFVGCLMAAGAAGLVSKKEIVHESIPWFLLSSMLIWSLIVRRVLV